jgi:prolyl-tRNA editing enzyme YbaK/EbsC (Cys-tRNA(Pro) deacylase)
MSDSPALDHPAVARVRVALDAAGLATEIVTLPAAAPTARAAAAQIGCDVAQIANSLVFRCATSGSPLLVMTSGANRVDPARVAALVGEPIGRADADFVRTASGFAIGGVAPVGHAAPIRTLIDRNLFDHDEIWAAGGHPHTVFRLTPGDLVRITGGTVAEVAA